MKQRTTKQQWLELLDEQEKSELSIAAFCRGKGINPKNFYNHARKARQSAPNTPAFVRAQLATNIPSPAEITLRHGKTQLTLPASVSPQWLARLILALP